MRVDCLRRRGAAGPPPRDGRSAANAADALILPDARGKSPDFFSSAERGPAGYRRRSGLRNEFRGVTRSQRPGAGRDPGHLGSVRAPRGRPAERHPPGRGAARGARVDLVVPVEGDGHGRVPHPSSAAVDNRHVDMEHPLRDAVADSGHAHGWRRLDGDRRAGRERPGRGRDGRGHLAGARSAARRERRRGAGGRSEAAERRGCRRPDSRGRRLVAELVDPDGGERRRRAGQQDGRRRVDPQRYRGGAGDRELLGSGDDARSRRGERHGARRSRPGRRTGRSRRRPRAAGRRASERTAPPRSSRRFRWATTTTA